MSSQQQGLPDETLRRILEQIQLTLNQSGRQLSLVKAQRAGKEREKKGIELTRAGVELEGKEGGGKVWRGVGKMFVADSADAVVATLKKQEAGIQEEMDNLAKKQKFLEKQVSDAQGHMRDFFRGVEASGQAQGAAAAS